VALGLTRLDTAAMNLFLAELSRAVTPGAHGVVLMDKAGWHTAGDLGVPENLSLVFLPPYSPELNPIERLWLHLRDNRLSHRVFRTTEEIVDRCCAAWNWLLGETGRIRSLCSYPGSHGWALNQVGMMHSKITSDHRGRGAVVYVRQSTMGQVAENTESQRRQYELAESARSLGFASVTVIDDDLGRSGSGLVERPGFQKLVASVCSGLIGAVFCIEASRLARNGRDWHHLIDLCALVGTLVIDPDGTYDPRQVNDRLLLGLKGTMSEYELSLLRQRGIAARDSKALRGELQFILPPGYCWNEIGQIEMDPDERVNGAIRLMFDKFQELGSARQVLLWAKDQDLQLPIIRRNNSSVCKSIGDRRPTTRYCRSSGTQSMPAPMSSVARPSARGSSRGALARPPAIRSRWLPGMCCCAIITRATSAGNSTKQTSS